MTRAHLPRRFLRALWPGRLRPTDLDWAETQLEPGELGLLLRLPRHDQRHLVWCGRRAEELLVGTEYAGDSQWIAASMLHDVGKYDAGLSPYGRAVATVAGHFGGPDLAYSWSEKPGFTRRVGLYLRHGELGADMIRLARGREVAAQWSEVHHFPDEWSRTGIPLIVLEALAEADDE